VRSSVRIPAHFAPPRLSPELAPDESTTDFVNRPCYRFNPALGRELDDAHCQHCRHYLTSTCPHIDEFIEDVEDLSPE